MHLRKHITYLQGQLERPVQSSLKLYLGHGGAPTLALHTETRFHHLLDLPEWHDTSIPPLLGDHALTVKMTCKYATVLKRKYFFCAFL